LWPPGSNPCHRLQCPAARHPTLSDPGESAAMTGVRLLSAYSSELSSVRGNVSLPTIPSGHPTPAQTNRREPSSSVMIFDRSVPSAAPTRRHPSCKTTLRPSALSASSPNFASAVCCVSNASRSDSAVCVRHLSASPSYSRWCRDVVFDGGLGFRSRLIAAPVSSRFGVSF
jgi:hypothetical protein